MSVFLRNINCILDFKESSDFPQSFYYLYIIIYDSLFVCDIMGKSKDKTKNIGRKSQLTFFKTLNCGVPAFKLIQDTYDLKDDILLQASSGLVGGLACYSSTCGFVSSGSIGLALLMNSQLDEWKIENEVKLHSYIKEYVNFFQDKYGSEICQDRLNLDFRKQIGVLGLFLPQKLYKDFSHASGGVKKLFSICNKILTEELEGDAKGLTSSYHCAQPVLEKIQKETSFENPVLEKISIALDGGVGLQGGVCGAIAASVMAINALIGLNYNETGYFKNLKTLLTVSKALKKKKENTFNPFYESNQIILKFLEKAGSLECKKIVEREFQDWKDFQEFRKSCEKCEELVKLCSQETITIINSF